MKRSRFTETQIVAILKEADAGVAVDDLCRQNGISRATYFLWRVSEMALAYPVCPAKCLPKDNSGARIQGRCSSRSSRCQRPLRDRPSSVRRYCR